MEREHQTRKTQGNTPPHNQISNRLNNPQMITATVGRVGVQSLTQITQAARVN